MAKRIIHSVTTVSWIPTDVLSGIGRLGMSLHLSHHDVPPPDHLDGDLDESLERLRADDRFRFANRLCAFIDVDDTGTLLDAGYLGQGLIGSTTLSFGVGSVTLAAVQLPDRRADPEIGDGWVRFTQTVGGRTGAPMPRPVRHPPFVSYRAPTVWTTLELTIHCDGRSEWALRGASAFPRHWVYDGDGALVAKSGLAEYKEWAGNSFGHRTPWGDEDSPVLVAEVESALEREMSFAIMGHLRRPDLVSVAAGRTVFDQGDHDQRIFLLLNGVVTVEVDGEPLVELGPGAVLGERAALEGGARTATVRARTDCKLAAVPADALEVEARERLAGDHHRETGRR